MPNSWRACEGILRNARRRGRGGSLEAISYWSVVRTLSLNYRQMYTIPGPCVRRARSRRVRDPQRDRWYERAGRRWKCKVYIAFPVLHMIMNDVSRLWVLRLLTGRAIRLYRISMPIFFARQEFQVGESTRYCPRPVIRLDPF